MSLPALALWGPPLLLLDGAAPQPLRFERRSQLLVLLALEPGRWWPREQLAALLWPGHEAGLARRNLRKVVFLAHELAGDAALQASEHALRWVGGSDLQDFAAAPRLALRRGVLLEGFDPAGHPAWSERLQQERQRWQALWQAEAGRALAVALDQGDLPGAEALARQMLGLDPLDETATEALMRVQLAGGQAAGAADTLRRYAAQLRETLGVEPGQALRALLQRPAGSAAPPVLPATVDDGFVGRRTELRLLDELLGRDGCRWLTLLGPGGVGKSRLARRWQQQRGQGLWVDLQDLTDAADVPARLAGALGVEPGPPTAPWAPLLLALTAQQRPLWVLDNAEQVQGLGALLAGLLGQAPGLRLLVTSRVRLHQPPLEWLLPLEGLAQPDEESRDAEVALSFDAVRLFAQRAQAARPGGELLAQLPAVLEVVERLGGLPLAIELAAGWTRWQPVARIAEQLRESPVVLEAEATGLERPQHASLRAVCEGSWALLGERERAALAALTVFAGGFDAAAARAVAGCPLPLLSALVDRSVLGVDTEGRFALHPVIAAFAGEQLAADPRREQAMRRAHARHFTDWLARLAPHAVGDTRRLAGIGRELPNLRRAWLLLLDAGDAAALGAGLRALWAWFEIESRHHEGVELLAPALRLPADTPAGRLLRARLAHGLSMLYHRLGNQAEALRVAALGQSAAADGPDTEAWVGCWLNAGSALWIQGQIAEARLHFEQGLAIARQRGDVQCEAWALGNLGVALHEQRDYAAAEAVLLQALQGSRTEGDLYNQAVHLNNLSTLMRSQGRMDEAYHWLTRLLEHARACELPVLQLYAQIGLGRLLTDQGRRAEAEGHLRLAHAEALRRGKGLLTAFSERALLRLRCEGGDPVGCRAALKPLLAAALSRQDWPGLVELLLIEAECAVALGERVAAAAVAASLLAESRLLEQQRLRLDRLGLVPGSAAPEPAAQLAVRLLQRPC